MPFFQPKRVLIEELVAATANTKNIRNICITAHVDHGKTSLCDALLMSNGIINFDGVGNYRFMDSRPDEQTRGITMKSSSIMLMYEKDQERYLVNLIDTPGHVDFTSEVSSAIQMCEGTIVVIDVVEGVCSQTQFVLQQCFVRNLDILLFFNKIDRLINEMNMDSVECYYRLYDLLEKVNSIFASFIHSSEVSESVVVDADKFHFSVYKKNVLFGSAVDGWAIDVAHFVRLYSKKWDVPLGKLAGKIWSDHYYEKKAFVSGARSKNKRPVFVSVILDNIFYLYKNFEKSSLFLDKIKKTLEINVNFGALQFENMSVADVRKIVLQKWQYLPDMIFASVVKSVAPPSSYECENDACFVVSKLVIVDRNSQILMNKKILSDYDDCVGLDQRYLILLVVKVLSGAFRAGADFFLFFNDKDKNEKDKKIEKIRVRHVFGVMGSNCYVPMEVGCAGSVLAVSFSLSDNNNLNNFKSNSIFCSKDFKNFDVIHTFMRRMNIDNSQQNNSIFKVVVEPKDDVTQMKRLFDSLKLMAVADNSMSVEINDVSGDCLLSITGEVHLQKILHDLKHYFCFDHELVISPPIVPFKETICEIFNENEENYLLPYYMRNILNEVTIDGDVVTSVCSIALPESKIVALKISLTARRLKITNKNVLSSFNDNVLSCDDGAAAHPLLNKLKHGLISGFKIAVKEGPLMNEPVCHVDFCVTDIDLTPEINIGDVPAMVWYSNAMSRMKLLCLASFVNSKSIRLMLPSINVTVYTDQSVMKKTYSVLSKRYAKILEEDHEYNEFVIKCEMLAIESFGMVQELYDRCKGLARASFSKKGDDGWTVLDQYPFVVDLDANEGAKANTLQDAEYQKNLAFKYIRQERLRKGLPFINQLVESGEKQRTLKKNK